MALLSIPIWSVPPDWADPVVEGLEWLTTVLTSMTGVEQRMSIRMSPRRYLEYTIRAIGEWRTYLDALLSTEEQVHFYMPVWYEQGSLFADVSSGANSFVVRGVRTELNAASVVFLRGTRPWEYDIAEVTSVSVSGGNTTFNLGESLSNSWKAGTKVHPVVVTQLNEQPKINRLSTSIAETSVRMDFVQKNDWALTPSLPSYRGFSVVEFPTNEGDTQSGSYFRVNSTLDNTIGLPLRRDIGGISFPGFTAANFITLRANLDALRSLLYFLRGRASAVWLVNPTDDFTLYHGMVAADTGIDVWRSGFAELNGPTTGRQDIRILLADGTALYRRITSATLNGDGVTETLNLDAAIGVDIPRNQVQQISFMAVGRLDQDLIELSHTTDADGVCNVTLVTKAVPDLRVAEDWDPPALQLTSFGQCGPTIPGQLWFRINNGSWNNSPFSNPSFGFLGYDISGIAGPYFPLGQVDANFDVPIDHKLQFNFGASAFRQPVPHRAVAWDDTGSSVLNGSDKNPNLLLSDGDLSMSRRLPSSAAGPGDNDNAARGNTNTSTQNGLRYFEVYTSPTTPPRGWSAGIANASAFLSDVSNGGAGGSVDPLKFILGNSAPTVSWGTGIAAGDTICVCIFT